MVLPIFVITAPDTSGVLSRMLPFIRDRGYEAGDRMPSERELAERFGVSRGILREALSALEASWWCGRDHGGRSAPTYTRSFTR